MPGRVDGTGTDSPPGRHEGQEGRRERREGGRRPRSSAGGGRPRGCGGGGRPRGSAGGGALNRALGAQRRLHLVRRGLPRRLDLVGAAIRGVAVRRGLEVGAHLLLCRRRRERAKARAGF